MALARTGHVCVALQNGTVLVAGGRTAGGGETNAAEIFHPALGAWRIIPPMTAARYGATASLLPDGRVLIAGGEAYGVALATLEIYDPATGWFEPVPGTLSAPRKDHAAAVISGGRVSLAGGSSGEAALDSVDVFEPATGEVRSVGAMSVARAGLSATTLLDGRVLLAGGNDSRTDLASMEIFDPSSGRFTVAASMDIPRRGHIALRIPNNNTVLIAGGTSAGEPLAEAGLYIPWWDAWRPHGVMAIGRYATAATAVGDRGLVMLAGGATKAAATAVVEMTAQPTIRTDKEDYSPGEWVTISGANWTPGGTVELVVKVLPERTVTRWQGTATAAADGTLLKANAFQMNDTDLGKTFELTAAEPATGKTAAAWVFTDANLQQVDITSPQSPNPVLTGSPATYTVTVTMGGNTNPCTVTLSASPSGSNPAPTGTTFVFSGGDNPFTTTNVNFSRTLTVTVPGVTASGTYGFTVTAARGSNCQGQGNVTTSGTIVITTKRATQTTLSLSPDSVVIGQDSTVTVTVTDTSPGTKQDPTGTIALSSTPPGPTFGACTLSATTTPGVSSCTTTVSSAAAGSFNITADFAETLVHLASADTKTLTVTKRATQTFVSLQPGTINEGGSTVVTAVVSDVATAGTKLTPTGTVSFASSSNKVTLSDASCTLGNGSNGSASCSVTATGLDGPDAPTITATYSGSGIHLDSSSAAGLTINNVPPTITSVTGPIDPIKVGAAASVTANFTDPGVLDTHTCSIDWDDGTTSSGAVNETNGSRSCTGTRTFSQAGVYTITVTITDKDGGSATAQYMYIVVYDPTAGFVTGGGWINSPPGAYAADPTLTRKATFGFVSKYQNGATAPTGNTEFQFHAAKFNFHTTYQWLVVAGAKAQYKGTGTVNGAGNYGFLLTATDGQISGGGVDKFRIKFWDISTGLVVYDNVRGASDDMDSANPQAIAGGSIVIHSK